MSVESLIVGTFSLFGSYLFSSNLKKERDTKKILSTLQTTTTTSVPYVVVQGKLSNETPISPVYQTISQDISSPLSQKVKCSEKPFDLTIKEKEAVRLGISLLSKQNSKENHSDSQQKQRSHQDQYHISVFPSGAKLSLDTTITLGLTYQPALSLSTNPFIFLLRLIGFERVTTTKVEHTELPLEKPVYILGQLIKSNPPTIAKPLDPKLPFIISTSNPEQELQFVLTRVSVLKGLGVGICFAVLTYGIISYLYPWTHGTRVIDTETYQVDRLIEYVDRHGYYDLEFHATKFLTDSLSPPISPNSSFSPPQPLSPQKQQHVYSSTTATVLLPYSTIQQTPTPPLPPLPTAPLITTEEALNLLRENRLITSLEEPIFGEEFSNGTVILRFRRYPSTFSPQRLFLRPLRLLSQAGYVLAFFTICHFVIPSQFLNSFSNYINSSYESILELIPFSKINSIIEPYFRLLKSQ